MPDVQPANQLIVELFFKCATQWNYAGMAGARTGLNYQAVDVRTKTVPEYTELEPELQSKVWDGLSVMEQACLKVWSEQSK